MRNNPTNDDAEIDPPDSSPPGPAWIMLIAVALVAIGVTMIYSASSDVVGLAASANLWKEPGLRQLYFVPPALGLMWLASRVPHTIWRLRRRWYLSPSLWLLAFTVASLAAVLAAPESIAPHINMAKRWFRFRAGGLNFNIQPSELAKLALVICLASILSDKRFNPRKFFFGLVPLAGIVAVVVGLVIIEDFGTAFLISLVAAAMLLVGRTRIWQLAMMVPPAAVVGFLFVYNKPARWVRVQTFLAGGGDPQGAGYHINQSLMTIASGGWFGRGLGEGIQKFSYLPEDTTDFIFAVLCEELGLAGAFIVIGLFVVLVWQLLRALSTATDCLGQLLVLGVTLTIGLQAAMNIAVVTNAIPTKGIALPFVSAGGSGLIIMSISLGLAASVARRSRRDLAELAP